jgi:hypothetical protein
VLDPACGSGNFLYLALRCLKDIEHQVNLEAEALGLERQHDVTGPHNVLGIELNEYAAELARVTVWIGELQWRIQRGYGFKLNPVLDPLDHIECRDAVLGPDGKEAVWPKADVGGGESAVRGRQEDARRVGGCLHRGAARSVQGARAGWGGLGVLLVRAGARARSRPGTLQRAGLVATNSIAAAPTARCCDRIVEDTRIFEAWSDEPWVNDGAAVRVSLGDLRIAGSSTLGRRWVSQRPPCLKHRFSGF